MNRRIFGGYRKQHECSCTFIPQLVDQELKETCIGMKFQSLDIEFKFYLEYAYCNGFSVHKNQISRLRKDKSIIGQELFVQKKDFVQRKVLTVISNEMRLEKVQSNDMYVKKRRRKMGYN